MAQRVKIRHNSRYKKRLAFYIALLALPLIQFAIFYIFVNAKSISMAFVQYEAKTDSLGYDTKFVWFENFKEIFSLLKAKPHLIVNSLRIFVFQVGLGLPLALIFSFYIYKKRFAHKYFKVILFLPQIISATVFAIIFFYFSDSAIPAMLRDWFGKDTIGVLSNKDTRLTALIIFTVWMSFGVNVLLFTGSMNGINQSLVEASELDGANVIQEFFHVTLPCIFPTVISFIIVGISGIFVEQMFIYTFSLQDPDSISTIGYFLYVEAQSQTDMNASSANHLSYPALSAFSLLITAVLFPLTMGVRKLLTKYGPNAK